MLWVIHIKRVQLFLLLQVGVYMGRQRYHVKNVLKLSFCQKIQPNMSHVFLDEFHTMKILSICYIQMERNNVQFLYSLTQMHIGGKLPA